MLVAEDILCTSTWHIFFDRAADDKCQGTWKSLVMVGRT